MGCRGSAAALICVCGASPKGVKSKQGGTQMATKKHKPVKKSKKLRAGKRQKKISTLRMTNY